MFGQTASVCSATPNPCVTSIYIYIFSRLVDVTGHSCCATESGQTLSCIIHIAVGLVLFYMLCQSMTVTSCLGLEVAV